MAACDLTRPLTQAQREAGFDQQRTGVGQALRPFSGTPTVENLIDYINRELGPVLRATRNAANDVWKQVVDNAPSANPLAFYFSTTTTNADPTAGRVRLNQAVQNTATVIRVSESNGRLQSVQPWLDVMSGGPTSPLGTVTLLDAINPGRFLRFDLNTMTDQGAYWDLGVTFIEGSDTSPFVDDEAVTIGFIAGVSAAGSTVPVGSLSPVASDTFLGNISGALAAPAAVPFTSVDSTSITYDTVAHELRRAALSGFVDAAANANTTSSAEPIVTYSASANMSNERVTTSSTSVTVSTAVAGQIEFQRAALTGDATAAANSNAVTVAYHLNQNQAVTWAAQQDDFARSATTINALQVTLTGDQTLTGITGGSSGDLLVIENVDATDKLTLASLDTSSASANRIRTPNAQSVILGLRENALLHYSTDGANGWRVLAGPQVGRLIAVTAYTETSPGSGTHTFDGRAHSYLVHIQAAQGGGGGANSAAGQVAVGGQGGGGAMSWVYVTSVPTSVTYTIGASGAGGASSGGDGSGGTATTWDSFTVNSGSGGKGSAHATLGSGSGTTLALTMGGEAGQSATGSLPSGGTVVMFKPGVPGQPGVRFSGTVGWGGGNNTSNTSGNGNGEGGFSANNSDFGGAAGAIPRITVWEFS